MTTKKKLIFQLMPNRAKEVAQQAINHTLKSGYASKINDYDVLRELIQLLDDPKFQKKYDIEFFRYDKKDHKTTLDFETVKFSIENGIDQRPIAQVKET